MLKFQKIISQLWGLENFLSEFRTYFYSAAELRKYIQEHLVLENNQKIQLNGLGLNLIAKIYFVWRKFQQKRQNKSGDIIKKDEMFKW